MQSANQTPNAAATGRHPAREPTHAPGLRAQWWPSARLSGGNRPSCRPSWLLTTPHPCAHERHVQQLCRLLSSPLATSVVPRGRRWRSLPGDPPDRRQHRGLAIVARPRHRGNRERDPWPAVRDRRRTTGSAVRRSGGPADAEWFSDWIDGHVTPEGGEPFAVLRDRAVAAVDRCWSGRRRPWLWRMAPCSARSARRWGCRRMSG